MRYSVWKWNRKNRRFVSSKIRSRRGASSGNGKHRPCVSLYLAPAPAYAIYCSNCSTFYQQMFEYAEAVNTQLNTAQQLATQIQQYQNMVTQGLSLPNSMFGSIAADLQSVANIYTKSQALGRQIQNMDSQFNTQFPGFESYLNQAANSAEAPARDRYQKWSEQGARQREGGDGSGEPQYRHFRV